MDNTKLDIVRKEIDDSHYYWVNGVFAPGVTSIIDEAAPMGYGLRMFLQNNTREEADEIKNTAGEFGSKMHDAYERLLNGIELDLINEFSTTREKKHLMSFYSWFNEYKPTNIKTEFTVASLEPLFAGTMDLSCTINGETWIIDFKTSKAIHKNHEYQLAAYKQAYESMTGNKVDHVAILRTGSVHKIGYEFKEVFTPFEEFANIYRTYLSLHDGKVPEPPLIDVYPDTLRLELAK